MTDAWKESLYSFEVAVKTIFLKRAVVCRVPSVAIRFLEYPALELNLVNDDELAKIRNLIESDPDSIAQSPQILQLQHSTGTYAFSQGKSCMIKMKLSELEESLTSIPVYVMVLDVLPSAPKLVASFALSLENAVRKIVRDVSVNGIDMPCAQGERDLFPLYNLMGTKVGEAEMGVRLSSLGINMIQHVSNIAMPESRIAENLPKNAMQVKSLTSTSITLGCKVKSEAPKKTEKSADKENLVIKEKLMVSDSTHTTKPKMPSKYVQHPIKPQTETLGSTENIFCPPALYYDQKSDTLERDICAKQQLTISHQLQSVDQSITLSDLENYGRDKIIAPSSVVYRPRQPQKKTFASSHATQTETAHAQDFTQSLTEFPILRALVAEVARLGLGQEQAAAPQHVPIVQKPDKKVTRDRAPFSKSRDQLFPLHKSPKKQPECKGPLKFGMTNTMRLRMAMTKATLEQRRKENLLKTSVTQDSLRQPRLARLGRTYDVKSPISKGGKKVKMVSTACGPEDSMYRRGIPRNVQQETVYMGRMTGFEEGGRAQDELAKDDEFGIEDLMIVKDIGTPRPYSRQSQRSIEIHLPTASTEFTIGKDDDWRSTVSDQEKLMEKLKAAEEDVKNDEPEFYTPPESTDTSRPQSAVQINVTEKDALKARLALSNEKFAQSDASDRYKYSDDFEDDRTWSATRTPSAMTPVNSTAIKEQEDEEECIPVRPSKSMDSTITTARTSDFASSAGEEFIHELRSASAQKITSSDDALETSSVSRGSVVTALIPARKGGLKVGNITVPEPIPSDSPIIQSINTESGSTENFPEPKKRNLASKSVQRKKKSPTKEVHLPKHVVENRKFKSHRKEAPVPKPSRLTPSPPSTRRYSPLSSPESSREKIRRMYHHPGRYTRPTSSGSASSDFDKPTSPVRRSDSVSSYQPSEMSDMSNVKLSEELENLSDILSEETDSQDAAHSIKMNNHMPADGPRTYFGKPKLDPSTKLGYTT